MKKLYKVFLIDLVEPVEAFKGLNEDIRVDFKIDDESPEELAAELMEHLANSGETFVFVLNENVALLKEGNLKVKKFK